MARRPTRDYVLEMEALVRNELAGDEPYTATAVAEAIAEKLRIDDKELLRGWLDVQSVDILRNYVATLGRSERSHNRIQSRRIKFRDALKQYEEGDPEILTTWMTTTFVVDENAVRKPLADMVRAEITFVADGYERQASSAAFEAAWFRAIAKKVGGRKVGDVYTEDQLVAMRNSIDVTFGH